MEQLQYKYFILRLKAKRSWAIVRQYFLHKKFNRVAKRLFPLHTRFGFKICDFCYTANIWHLDRTNAVLGKEEDKHCKKCGKLYTVK